jgi:predicted enzyme involved in methoxymalonyl-ACP biosynthesis
VAILGPLEGGAREVDSLLLSCRVMGRQVETALLDYLAESTRSSGGSVLRGVFIPTPKNAPARDCYERQGFELIEERPDGSCIWELNVTDSSPRAPEWLTVRAPELVGVVR